MARPPRLSPRVHCPECGSNRMPKDGASKGRQVYHCGDCGRSAIPATAYHADQERALAMYQEGSSLSAIARIFGVSAQAVSQWVKKGGAPPGPGCAGGVKSGLPAR